MENRSSEGVFPIKHGGIFHCYVSLPEGIFFRPIIKSSTHHSVAIDSKEDLVERVPLIKQVGGSLQVGERVSLGFV